MIIKKFIHYLNPRTMFSEGDPAQRRNLNLKFMHGINRISILLFLFALIVMAVRYFMRHA